jgi:hypothetical protein
VYDWATDTSGPHDYGDCMAMAYALAAVNDIGTGGGNGPRKKKQNKHKGVTVINI